MPHLEPGATFTARCRTYSQVPQLQPSAALTARCRTYSHRNRIGTWNVRCNTRLPPQYFGVPRRYAHGVPYTFKNFFFSIVNSSGVARETTQIKNVCAAGPCRPRTDPRRRRKRFQTSNQLATGYRISSLKIMRTPKRQRVLHFFNNFYSILLMWLVLLSCILY